MPSASERYLFLRPHRYCKTCPFAGIWWYTEWPFLSFSHHDLALGENERRTRFLFLQIMTDVMGISNVHSYTYITYQLTLATGFLGKRDVSDGD